MIYLLVLRLYHNLLYCTPNWLYVNYILCCELCVLFCYCCYTLPVKPCSHQQQRRRNVRLCSIRQCCWCGRGYLFIYLFIYL